MESTIGWFPHDPSQVTIPSKVFSKKNEDSLLTSCPRHEVWKSLDYLIGLRWSRNLPKTTKEGCRRHYIEGVEVRDLGPKHPLSGEKGLFATKRFHRFDILGEYTGCVVDSSVSGHYVAALEDKSTSDSLGVDARDCGNELRFINGFHGIEFGPNVIMKTAYIDSYPHVIVICITDIEIGEEFLLDYGAAYNEAFLLPKATEKIAITGSILHSSDLSSNSLFNELAGANETDDTAFESL